MKVDSFEDHKGNLVSVELEENGDITLAVEWLSDEDAGYAGDYDGLCFEPGEVARVVDMLLAAEDKRLDL